MADYLSYVEIIDGKVIRDGMANWARPVPIEPGARKITAIFEMGAHRAPTELSFVAEAGKTYEVANRCDESRVLWVEMWIQEKDTRKVVSDVVHQETRGGTTYIPIIY